MADSTFRTIKGVLSGRSTLIAVPALALSAAAVFFLWARGPGYQQLYPGLGPEDSRAVIEALAKKNVPYRADGTGVSVPAGQVQQLRTELAAEGLPHGGGAGGAAGSAGAGEAGEAGFEIFDHTGFGVSRFVQRVNYRRALQGELARTIAGMKEVESARVHLALPEKSIFLEKEKKARASIIVKLKPGAELGPARAASIVHLVSGSLTNLSPEDVTVVDTDGRMWSGGGSGGGAVISPARYDYRQALERELEGRVATMLEKVVGAGKAVVRVSAEVNGARVERTEETFDPGGRVVRRERREGAGTRAQGGNEVIDYEISRVVSHVVEPVGEVTRLTAAVVVDGAGGAVTDGDADGGPAGGYLPRSPEELAGLREMVKGAIGFSAERGDVVTVTSAPFHDILPGLSGAETAGGAVGATGLAVGAGGAVEAARITPAYLGPVVIKYTAATMAALVALLLVARPIAGRFSYGRGKGPGDGPARGPLGPEARTTPKAAGGEGQASDNLAAVRDLAKDHPRQAAMVIRKWLKEN